MHDEKVWRFPELIDRSGWPAGEWDNEPDKIEWRDAATGIPCLVRRGPLGQWCGYVAVPPGHPWHGVEYMDIRDCRLGLTYSAACEPEDEFGICHVPQDGEPDDVWWLGFDFGHAFDIVPYLAGRYGHNWPYQHNDWPRTTYKTVGYARTECASLARQIADYTPPEATRE